MKSLRLPAWTFPLALIVALILAFGLLIPWLGYYQDDWYQIWFGRAFGSQVYLEFFARERPFIAWLYMLTTPLVGTKPLNWQIFALLSRLAAALSVWWMLRLVWPTRARQVAWITLLFLLYPAFRIQYAAVIYSHYFLQMAIQMLSIVAMLLALRRPRWFWPLTIFAVLTALISLFSSEYFFGLEWLRPVFLFIVLSEGQSQPLSRRLKRTFIYWSPYLAATLGFLVWRIFIFKFPTYQPFYTQTPGAGPLALVLQLAGTVLKDVFLVGLYTWIEPVTMFGEIGSRLPSTLAALGLAVVCAVLLAAFLAALRLPEGSSAGTGDKPSPADSVFAWQLVLTGLFSLLLAGWPFWFVDLPVNTDINTGSRFTISFMLGASLLVVGLVELLLRKRVLKVIAVAAIAGLAIGWHFKDANLYRQIHRSQATFFQQLAWRAPGLKPGTLVLMNTFNEYLSGDNSLTAALNWIYEPAPPYSLQYMLFFLPDRLVRGFVPGLEPGLAVTKDFRTTQYRGSTSDALVVYYDAPNCLRVLNPAVDGDLPRPLDMPKELRDTLQLSNLSQIIASPTLPAALPTDIFRYTPEADSWCYYFEKADLRRQEGDWQAVAQLGDQALRENRKLANTWELLPFIEGYARAGQMDKARALTMQAHRSNPEGRAMTTQLLCTTWKRLETGDDGQAGLGAPASQLQSEIGCNQD